MSASGIKSKPVYSPLRADLRGRRHLMVGHGAGSTALLRVIGELRAHDAALLEETCVLFVADGIEVVGGAGTAGAVDTSGGVDNADGVDASPALKASGVAVLRSFDAIIPLLAALRSLLERSSMGLRLYVAGPEHFIGRVLTLALEFDLNKDEIGAEELGSLARRLYCVHCQTTTEYVTTNIAACNGCGRWLMVRDHYSRRLAAYMGVMVDAEAPGERPPVAELYS